MPTARKWHFIQSLRGVDASVEDKQQQQGQTITAVQFNADGQYLAVGDRAGRIWVYKSAQKTKPPELNYQLWTHFQSHTPDFDYLKSLEIEEKINMIRFCPNNQSSLFLLSTNDKSIRLWRMHEHAVYSLSNLNADADRSNFNLRIPKLSQIDKVPACEMKQEFSNAHVYHINSISMNSDQETFLSADDLRINMWHLSHPNTTFNFVDIKPDNMDELSEVITSAQFHPNSCNLLAYSSSRGYIRIMDTRNRALCSSPAMFLCNEEDPHERNFFSEIITSISDIQFTPDGRYILSRDYLTMKIWDLHMAGRPLEIIPIHDHLTGKLNDVYENDCIFDKFETATSYSGRQMASGSYNNEFIVFDWTSRRLDRLSSNVVQRPLKRSGSSKSNIPKVKDISDSKTARSRAGARSTTPSTVTSPLDMDFTQKSLHLAWHPRECTIAVAALNQLHIHQQM